MDKKLDFVASIPYRIVGVLLCLVMTILGIPVIWIPYALAILNSGSNIDQVQDESTTFIMSNFQNAGSLISFMKEKNDISWKIIGVIVDKLALGISMVTAGIYYDEFYDILLNEPFNRQN